MIHVTFSSSGAGSLRQALGIRDKRQKVVDITEQLSLGPIAGADFVEREAWLNANLPWAEQLPHTSCWDWIASDAEEFLKKLERSDEHLVWVAPQNADELCGLHWYLDKIGGLKARFVVVDHGIGDFGNGQLHGIGELGPEQFQFLLEKADYELWDKQRFPASRWAQLCEASTNLRIVDQGKATSVPDDYFDDVLLEQCSREWRKAYRVMVDAMIAQWDARHYMGDDVWLWRLRELVSHGKLLANREIVQGAFASRDPILVRLAD